MIGLQLHTMGQTRKKNILRNIGFVSLKGFLEEFRTVGVIFFFIFYKDHARSG